MDFPTEYTCLIKNKFLNGDYKIVPIRFEDRLDIMKWRNEQLYHLRQTDRGLPDRSRLYTVPRTKKVIVKFKFE